MNTTFESTITIAVSYTHLFPEMKVIEAGWYQQMEDEGLKITFLPAQHWSKRSVRDGGQRLWGAFMLQGNGISLYYSGDTGYSSHFREKMCIRDSKKCELIPVKELLPLTGYIRGGCSPIGMKKHFPTYIHETSQQFPYIYVSAGVRGLQIKIAPEDLIRESRAEICRLFEE